VKLAATTVVRSLWQGDQVRIRYFEKVSALINYHQRNIARSAESHNRATREKLRHACFDLPAMRCCILV